MVDAYLSGPGPRPWAPFRLLVVDDDADTLESIVKLVRSELPNVLALPAHSSDEAVRILRGQPVDAVLCDYRMPGMDGLELLRKVQLEFPDVIRLVMTAFPKLEIAINAINELEVERFLVKPIQPGQLVLAVESLARKRRPLSISSARRR